MAITDVTGTASSGAATQNAKPAPSVADKLASEQTFLTLLVKQIQNQDPMNPADGTQFVAQLAQFSELEQMIGMRQELSAMHKDFTAVFGTADSGAGASGSADNAGGTQPANGN